MGRLLVLLAVLGLASAVGLAVRARNGRLRAAVASDTERLSADEIGVPLGERATLVQFSSAFCAPCRATRRILADVAAVVPGVSHVELDAESRLDLVRRLGVMRTPTTLLLDGRGVVRQRASGQPRKDEVVAALSAIVG
jgi:thiol-disulfide isomerase/thioredoxin